MDAPSASSVYKTLIPLPSTTSTTTTSCTSDNNNDEARSFETEQHRLSAVDESILLHHNITVIDHLGEGFYGHVWKGRYKPSGKRLSKLKPILFLFICRLIDLSKKDNY